MTTPAAPDTTNSIGSTSNESKGGLFNTGESTILNTIATQIAADVTAAQTSADNASASATTATEQATISTTQATNSANSATASANSATASSNSATSAANTLDAFDDRYLGNKTSDPSTDNDGDALLTGALYFKTTDNIMRVYTGSAWTTVKPTTTEQGHINTVSGIQANVTTVAGISSNVTTVAGNNSNINTVAGNNSNITTVAGISSDVTGVANISSAVSAVNSNATNINAVNSNSTNINAVNSNSSNINTVAGANSNITSVANNISNINTVAGIFEGTATYTVTVVNDGGNKFAINTGSGSTTAPALTLVKGFTYTFDVSDNTNSGHPLAFKDSGGNAYTTGVTVNGTAGQAGATVVFAVPSTGTQPARYYCTQHGNGMGNTITTTTNDIASVLAISSEITTVSGIDSEVTAVAGKATEIGLLGVSSVITDMGLLGTSANVTAMGHLGTSANVTAMGLLGTTAVVEDMGFLGTSAVVEDMGFLGTSANVTAMGHLGTSANVTAMGLLGTSAVVEDMGFLGTSANVTAMSNLGTSTNVTNMANLNASGVIANIATVAGAVTNVNTVGSNISHVNTVSGAIANVNTVATNITNVNTFANTYFIGSSAPTGGTVGSGDLWYDTSSTQMKVHNGSSFVTFISTYDTDDLSEGSSNLYFTNTRADARITNAFSNAVSLGNNLTVAGELRGPATFVIDPAVVGNNTGLVQIKGNLQVDGTTTTINSTTLDVADKNITVADGSANAAAANGAGLTIDCGSDTDATFTYANSDDSLSVNKTFKAPAVKIDGADAASQGFAVAMAIAL